MEMITVTRDIDMNDPVNLAFYTQLYEFRMDFTLRMKQFHSPNKLQQRVIQSLAHAMGLEYEYSRETQAVTITRENVTSQPDGTEEGNVDFATFNSERISGKTLDHSSSFPVISDSHETEMSNSTEEFNSCSYMSGYSSNNELDKILDFDFSSDYWSDFHSSQPSVTAPWPSRHSITKQTTGSIGHQSSVLSDQEWFPDPSGYIALDLDDNSFCSPVDLSMRERPQSNGTSVEPLSNSRGMLLADPIGNEYLSIGHEAHLGYSLQQIGRNNQHENHPATDRYGSNHILCTYEGCERSIPGNGFSGHLNMLDHKKRIHDCAPGSTPKLRRRVKKRKNSFAEAAASRKPSSMYSNASSGYQEIIFDWNSAHPSDQGSAYSGRSGPLDKVAIAAMRLVRAVGACWKCKFLRKKCKPESPCEECLKNNNTSLWQPIGCKRGTLQIEMYPIKLCPGPGWLRPGVLVLHGTRERVDRATSYLQDAIRRREQELMTLGSKEIFQEDDNFSTSEPKEIRQYMFQFLTGTRYSLCKHPLKSASTPLNECILQILWELQQFPSSRVSLGARKIDDFIFLIRSATEFQAQTESNHLISQSLICLRSCLEVMNANSALHFSNSWHSLCNSECQLKCLEDLDLHVTLYLNELDRVFFNKENQHDKKSWWLSAFYSFSIQAFVRKALMQISKSYFYVGDHYRNRAGFKQYLHLAVRLFIASSGTYDPFVLNLSSSPTLSSTEYAGQMLNEHYKLAQVVARFGEWESRGIKTSGDYLKSLFEDTGEVLVQRLDSVS